MLLGVWLQAAGGRESLAQEKCSHQLSPENLLNMLAMGEMLGTSP